jgi:hypothetical protein
MHIVGTLTEKIFMWTTFVHELRKYNCKERQKNRQAPAGTGFYTRPGSGRCWPPRWRRRWTRTAAPGWTSNFFGKCVLEKITERIKIFFIIQKATTLYPSGILSPDP